MSRLFIVYLFSLTVRSLALAGVASIFTLGTRNVAARHAVWTMVLALMMLMPAADAFLPVALIPASVQEVVFPVQTFVVFAPQATFQAGLSTTPAPREWSFDWWWIAGCLVVFVTLLFLSRLALAYREVWCIRQGSRPVAASELTGNAAKPGGRTPAIHESGSISVPVTVGVLKPILILPSDWRGWESWKLRAVLFHELTHVRRFDWAIAVTAALAKCMFWFNPLAWWLERKLSALCEQASDEASVRWTGDAPRYAETLLQFATAAKNGHRWMGGVAMAQHKIGFRIERILSLRRPGSGVFPGTGWLRLMLLAIPALYASAAAQSSVQAEAPTLSAAEILRGVQQHLRIPDAAVAATPPQEPAQTAFARVQVVNSPELPAPVVPSPNAATPINPDLVGEIRLILAPVEAPAGGGNGQVQIQTQSGNRWTGTAVWNIRNSPLSPAAWNRNANAFAFALTGIQGRTISFEDGKGETFSYGCPDCSFVVWESGVAGSSTNPGPGIVFRLSADGKSLSATCQAAQCSIGAERPTKPGTGQIGGDFLGLSFRTFSSSAITLPIIQAGKTCFSFLGAIKPDGAPFTDADCPDGRTVTAVMSFSITK